MAKIRKRKLTWKASPSSRVTGYKVYWASDRRLDYDAPCADVGNVTAVLVPDDLTGFTAAPPNLKFGVTAVDSEGNESDMSVIEGAGFFQAPERPSRVRIEEDFGVLEIPRRHKPPDAEPIEETRDALVKIETLLSRFFQEE